MGVNQHSAVTENFSLLSVKRLYKNTHHPEYSIKNKKKRRSEPLHRSPSRTESPAPAVQCVSSETHSPAQL